MKKALLILVAGMMAASVYAQGTANGNIIFANRNVPTVSGTGGGNGNGTYNIPIWEFNALPGIQQNGSGDLAGGVTVGLFQASNLATALATTLLRTDANSQFFATSATPVEVPGVAPGQTAALVVRAWQGAGGHDAARDGFRQYGSWAFTSRPLGGTPPQPGSTPVPTPNMTGWGPENGEGFELSLIPEPSTYALCALGIGALLLRRRK